jgi:hypothetical protein
VDTSDRKNAENYRHYKVHKVNKHTKERRRDKDIRLFGFHVTDHAVIRYLERVKDENINNVRINQVVTNDVKEKVAQYRGQSTKRIYTKGYELRVKDRTVVTVI